MTPQDQPSPQSQADGKSRTRDKSLFATLSFIVEEEDLRDYLQIRTLPWDARARKSLQDSRFDAKDVRHLQDTVDPLFNDIAVRDRNSALSEFLLPVPARLRSERIRIHLPAAVDWMTEGEFFHASFDGAVSREATVRPFWYVHESGMLSYHVSFEVPYAGGATELEIEAGYERDKFETFYFLAAFQKLVFPKELERTATAQTETGIDLLDRPTVTYRDEMLPFFAFLARGFDEAFRDFEGRLAASTKRRHDAKPVVEVVLAPWKALVKTADFIEIPGLRLQPARGLFLFKDAAFFERLMSRDDAVRGKTLRPVLPAPKTEAGETHYILDKSLLARLGDPAQAEYYFLAGFFQNIIDFFNQDSSEISDGTDPIYPASPEQAAEAYFFRFANARCLYQVVADSRSLDVGADDIGTCPYIFLVHLTSMHNEFLIRQYERRVHDVLERLESGDRIEGRPPLRELVDPSKSEDGRPEDQILAIKSFTGVFYAFRHQAFAAYERHLYGNIFRYDTESDVFEAVSRIRGIEKRLADCNRIVEGTNRTVRDLEENIRRLEERRRQNSDRLLNIFVFIVGAYGALQALISAHDSYEHMKRLGTVSASMAAALKCSVSARGIACPGIEWTEAVADLATIAIYGLTACLIFAGLSLLVISSGREAAGKLLRKWQKSLAPRREEPASTEIEAD